VVCFEVLTCRAPFAAENVAQVVQVRRVGAPPRPPGGGRVSLHVDMFECNKSDCNKSDVAYQGESRRQGLRLGSKGGEQQPSGQWCAEQEGTLCC
jgi:hypothetical protein